MARQRTVQEYLKPVELVRLIVAVERALAKPRPALKAKERVALEIAVGWARARLLERRARV